MVLEIHQYILYDSALRLLVVVETRRTSTPGLLRGMKANVSSVTGLSFRPFGR